jgi:hypothetical protein
MRSSTYQWVCLLTRSALCTFQIGTIIWFALSFRIRLSSLWQAVVRLEHWLAATTASDQMRSSISRVVCSWTHSARCTLQIEPITKFAPFRGHAFLAPTWVSIIRALLVAPGRFRALSTRHRAMHALPARFLPPLAHLTARSAQMVPSLHSPALYHASVAPAAISVRPTRHLGLALIAVAASTALRALGPRSHVPIKCLRLADGVG